MATEENEVKEVGQFEEDWHDCIFCLEYGKRTQTVRYCGTCGAYYCEGTHGRFHPGGQGFCCSCATTRKKFRERLAADHAPVASKEKDAK